MLYRAPQLIRLSCFLFVLAVSVAGLAQEQKEVCVAKVDTDGVQRVRLEVVP